MTRLLALLLLCALAAVSLAQGFVPEGEGFVWKRNDEFIRFDKGRFSAGIQGGKRVQWHTFLWHDNWVYETLHGGTIESGPSLQPDGSVTMTGLFSAREGSAPMRYALTLTPTADGVRVRQEFAKTGPLKLTSGVWLHVFMSRDEFSGAERFWARPSWGGALRQAGEAAAHSLLVELRPPRSLCLSTGALRALNTEGSQRSFIFRYCLIAGDFDADTRPVAEQIITFEDMPASLPGEVRPMHEPLAIRGAVPSASTVPLYEKLELSVDLSATYDNPFDPDDVALDALFTAPSGKQVSVPGFFMVRQRREVTEGTEVMIPEGNGEWRVRFAPTEVGVWSWRLTLRDRTGQVSGGEGRFQAVTGPSRGFVRRSTTNSRGLAFDNGEGYFAIGHNLPIYHTQRQLGDEAMRRFAAAKENYNRWWMCSYGFGIEWSDRLGWYRQDAAARIDLVLDLARELGLYYMMCMDTHQDFREGGWERNPFNVKNGGPCASPAEWFTNETARALYKKRLRYTVARWAYSPHVLCWEFGNEFEGWADSPDEVKLPWHREMSDYLRSIDPFGHLITTSFWGHTGPPAYWALPNIDIVQTHLYTNDNSNVAERVRQLSLKQWREFDKPHIFGEFGIRSHETTADKDPQGWGIHNALWAGLTSFCAGGPMPWWHENYIEPLDLYFHFTALANFTADLPLGTARWEPQETLPPQFMDKTRPPQTRDVEIVPLSRWGKPEHNQFVILPDGSMEGDRRPQQLLQGQGHADLKNEPTFLVNYPSDGQFIIHIGVVSNSGLLRVWVDDEQKLELELPCGEGLGKSSVWRPQWNLWETTYDREVAVDVPAGRHRIRVENFGKDWVAVRRYVFTGCKLVDKPNLLVCGMKTRNLAVIWIQNRDSDWFNHSGGGKVIPVPASEVTLTGLPDGTYEVEWWETWKGSPQRRETIEVRAGQATLRLPELVTDTACKLRKAP